MDDGVYSFGTEPIVSHAWNSDRTQLALSLNDHLVCVSRQSEGTWLTEQTLEQHSQHVTGIDWSPVTNKIVTCGADRNAYVWTLTGGKWEPVLVVLRINRAATCVKWSPLGNKFAVGTGAKRVAVCYYEPDSNWNWWLSKHITKPMQSTVTSVDWHPNNALLACGSTDMHTRVFSAYVKEVDEQPSATPWGSKTAFGHVLADFACSEYGWVHAVSFSASGRKLAWVCHGSSISVADAANGNQVTTVTTDLLPFTCLTWVTESSIVAAGHDYFPALFLHDDKGTLSFVTKLDVSRGSSTDSVCAMKLFKDLDSRATSEVVDAVARTRHQNAVLGLNIHTGTKDSCSKFSSADADGQIIIWDFRSLETSIKNLKLI